MISESIVVNGVKRWLENLGWSIAISRELPINGESSNYPFSISTTPTTRIQADIIARRDGNLLIILANERFSLSDFKKINQLRTGKCIQDALISPVEMEKPKHVWIGAAFAHIVYQEQKAQPYLEMVDFLVVADGIGHVDVMHSPHGNIFHPSDRNE